MKTVSYRAQKLRSNMSKTGASSSSRVPNIEKHGDVWRLEPRLSTKLEFLICLLK